MSYIADLLLAAGAFGAGFYCFVLSRRLRRFNDLERGVGGAVALLSAQVDDLTRALSGAQEGARKSRDLLADRIARAEAVATRLELLIASVHDVEPDPAVRRQGPTAPSTVAAAPVEFVRRVPMPEMDR